MSICGFCAVAGPVAGENVVRRSYEQLRRECRSTVNPVLTDLRASSPDARWRRWRSVSVSDKQFLTSSLSPLQSSHSILRQEKLTSRLVRLQSVPVTASEEALAVMIPLDRDLVNRLGPWKPPRVAAMHDMWPSTDSNKLAGRQELGDGRIVRNARLNNGGHERFDNVNSPRESVTSNTESFWRRYMQSKMLMPQNHPPRA